MAEEIACQGGNMRLSSIPALWSATVAGKLSFCLLMYNPPDPQERLQVVFDRLVSIVKVCSQENSAK